MLPVVVLSGSRRQQDIDAAYSAGANAYVPKPIDAREFDVLLRSLLDWWGRTLPAVAAARRGSGVTEGETPHVLVVDDSREARFARRRTLERAGFVVTEAATGLEGIAAVDARPDVVVLDVNLPDIDGLEVCRRMRTHDHGRHLAILQISSATIDPKSQVSSLEGGADAFLVEPVDAAVLVATTRALLRLHAAEAASARGEHAPRARTAGGAQRGVGLRPRPRAPVVVARGQRRHGPAARRPAAVRRGHRGHRPARPRGDDGGAHRGAGRRGALGPRVPHRHPRLPCVDPRDRAHRPRRRRQRDPHVGDHRRRHRAPADRGSPAPAAARDRRDGRCRGARRRDRHRRWPRRAISWTPTRWATGSWTTTGGRPRRAGPADQAPRQDGLRAAEPRPAGSGEHARPPPVALPVAGGAPGGVSPPPRSSTPASPTRPAPGRRSSPRTRRSAS